MKLLVDAHVFDGMYQGTRTYIEGLYKHLILYDSIDFFFAAQDIKKLNGVFDKTSNVHYIQLNSKGSIKRLSYEWRKIISDYKIDYAHFQYISPIVKCCKEIVTIHDLLFLDYPQYFPLSYKLKNNFFFRRSARRADILLTVSEYSSKRIAHHYGINEQEILVTPNSVLPIKDCPSSSAIKKDLGIDKFILTVGRTEPRKNFLILLKAFVELGLHERGYKLLIVGALDLKYQEFNKYFSTLPSNIKKSVIMTSVSFPELVSLYKSASLFVFPSFAEGFGIPPLEAIEYGCPLLCSNSTAMEEFGLPEAITFSPDNLDELKRKMLEQLSNPYDIGLSKKNIMAKYDWQHAADVLYSALKKNEGL